MSEKETPLMKQYNTIKGKYPDALLLFRVGDFYETFGDDAIKTSKILGIVLTRRANGAATYVELAGFPHHSLETYLPKLVRAGQRVAICDQLEDPKLTKTIVKRDVTELVTPGVSYNDNVLDHKSNNFLASVHFTKENCGVSFLDVSTGEFYVAQGNLEYIDKLLQSFNPGEVLFQKSKNHFFKDSFQEKFYSYGLEDWIYSEKFGYGILVKHFGTTSLKGFGIEGMDSGIISAGAALHYLAQTQHDKVQHLSSISRLEEDHYVWMDKFTLRNLEIFSSSYEKGTPLISILDKNISPMGSRMLRRWVALPLKDIGQIEERQNTVSFFIENNEIAEALKSQIHIIGDLERLISKVAVGRINPREMVQLWRALSSIEPIKNICETSKNLSLITISEKLNLCSEIKTRIAKEVRQDAPFLLNKGRVINDEVSEELDELRKISYSGKDYLLEIQQREIKNTGISSLKVAFNNVFGYYLEVTNVHKNKVPSDWHRKQTLSNCERYITEELKEYETKILGAEEKILALEAKIFNDLVSAAAFHIAPIQQNAAAIGRLDCLLSFAQVSKSNNYIRPEINESKIIDIIQGRHPVIEKLLDIGEPYIANDIYLDDEKQQIIMITGPNMSGKSALLRQTALIVIMAQIGCFVPARSASIGMVDKIFTRVGASDNISSGESTFMVEMNETASILNNLSSRSLILLDEIGRGTSTYDGISIAWAIAEFLHQNPARPKTLFATHYHELNEMCEIFLRIKNHNVSVKEIDNKIIFMRKLVPGGSEHSFGIHVAKMAGMPKIVVERANEIMKQLEERAQPHGGEEGKNKTNGNKGENVQLSFFQLDDPLLSQIKEEIQNTDINTLTPVEALMKLNEIKKLLK